MPDTRVDVIKDPKIQHPSELDMSFSSLILEMKVMRNANMPDTRVDVIKDPKIQHPSELDMSFFSLILETKVMRNANMPDTRVHACLYFIAPSG
jgi:septin family protein